MTTRERRLRKTKAQLIDEIDTLEKRAAAIEATTRSGAPMPAKAGDRYLADQELADLSRFPSENPNPVLGAMPDGAALYANEAATAVKGLLVGRKRNRLSRKIAKVLPQLLRRRKPRTELFASGGRLYALVLTPVAGETYVNIYGRDVTDEHAARQVLVAAKEASAAAEAMLFDAIENISDGFVLYDSKGRLVLCNGRFRDIYGYSEADTKPGVCTYESLGRLDAGHGTLGRQPLSFTQRVGKLRRTGRTETIQHIGDRIIERHQSMTPEEGIVSIHTDITERKRAEEELAEKEAQLRVALDNMPGGMELVDRDWNYVFFNPQFSELHDYPDGLLKVGGSVLDETRFQAERGDYGPGDPDELMEEAHVPFRSGKPESYERKLPGGRTLHFNVAPTPDGGYVTIATDVTEQKRAEAELAEKEAQLRVALDNMPGGMKLIDGDRKYVLFNTRYSELHDYPDGLLKVGGSILDEARFQAERGDYGPGDPEKLIEESLVLYESGEPESYERTLPGGRTLQFYSAPTPDGGFVSIVTDITGRKRAEEELADKEAQLRLALDNMPGGMALEDRDGNYVLFNSQYSELHDYPEGFLKVGMSTREEVRFQAERGDFGPGNKDDLIEQVVATHQGGKAASWERTFPDGRTLRFSVAPTPEGGYVAIVTDITERKRAEAELAEKEAQLRVALDNMPGGIRLIDGNRNYVLCNQQYLDLYNYPEGLLKVGDSIRVENLYCAQRGDLGPGDPETLVDEWLSTAPEQTEYSGWEWTLEGGKVLQVRTSPLPDRGVVNVVTDITERKQAEQELAESQERLQALADYMQVALSSMSDGIYILDGDLNIFAFNQRYVDLLNFPEGLVREGGSIVDVVEFAAKRGDYGSQFDGDIDDVVAGRLKQISSNEQYSTEHITPTGRIVEFRGSPIKGGGFVTIMHDITERKQAEAALLEAKRRAEEASKLVAEKNQMLESLSNQLSKYLSPQVYASIFSGEQSVGIASERKKLTVFFSDIADFTGTTDSLESEELTNLLNHYLTEMSKIALDFGATIDKYVGDAIIAFFGDPETRGVKEDARACVNMAIAMQRRMRELRSEWLDMGLERPFELRIGINTGFCTVGNFGSADRMDYTIIGNEVNLAARLEALAEVGGILMAHETHALVKDTVLAEEGDALTVKGFTKPVRTYSVVGLYDDLVEQGRVIRKEQDGVRVLVDLEKGDKAEAIQAIEDVLSQLKG